MSSEEFMFPSSGWPVFLGAGLMLGGITVASAQRRAHLIWFLPVLLLGAPRWLLFAAPAVACLASSPLAGYVTLVAVCELTGDCP